VVREKVDLRLLARNAVRQDLDLAVERLPTVLIAFNLLAKLVLKLFRNNPVLIALGR
jgi:hypothetical protein